MYELRNQSNLWRGLHQMYELTNQSNFSRGLHQMYELTNQSNFSRGLQQMYELTNQSMRERETGAECQWEDSVGFSTHCISFHLPCHAFAFHCICPASDCTRHTHLQWLHFIQVKLPHSWAGCPVCTSCTANGHYCIAFPSSCHKFSVLTIVCKHCISLTASTLAQCLHFCSTRHN